MRMQPCRTPVFTAKGGVSSPLCITLVFTSPFRISASSGYLLLFPPCWVFPHISSASRMATGIGSGGRFNNSSIYSTYLLSWSKLSVYQLPFNCIKITKLITVQFKLLHRRLATNDFLTKIGIKYNVRCTFCEVELENLSHLFWFCTITSSFWQTFKRWSINDKNRGYGPYLFSHNWFETQCFQNQKKKKKISIF